MTTDVGISGYRYSDGNLNESHDVLLPTVLAELDRIRARLPDGQEPKVFDLGCGNGSVGTELSKRGWKVSGVDVSEEGIAHATAAYPDLDLHLGSAYDDLASRFGRFPALVSLEVVEHVYAPRAYAKTVFDLLEPGGTALISTPYHGYVKNLMLAVTGKMDRHFTALWDHGHIKFWSMATLKELLEGAGLNVETFHRVGRIPVVARSMIAVARRPA